jgi:ribonuclease P/MRP protein subunit RPP1
MKRTDSCVFPYPAGDTSLRRFALEAKGLGYDAIVCVGTDVAELLHGVRIVRGVRIHDASMHAVISRIKRCRAKVDLVMVEAGDAAFNRAALSYHGVDILCNLYSAQKKAFDHVAARNAAEKGVAVEICLYPLIHQSGGARQRALSIYADVLRLHRRYEFPITVSSGAHSYLDLRSLREVARICSLFGMEGDEVTEAFSTVGRLMNAPKPVEVIP